MPVHLPGQRGEQLARDSALPDLVQALWSGSEVWYENDQLWHKNGGEKGTRRTAWHQDAAYDPPFSDFNLVIDNHGAAVNVSVPMATVRIKFRYSARVDPTDIVDGVRASAARNNLALSEAREAHEDELNLIDAILNDRMEAGTKRDTFETALLKREGQLETMDDDLDELDVDDL